MLLVMGSLSAYCFGLIGRTCALMREPTYDSAWVRAVGPGSQWLITGSLSAKSTFTARLDPLGLTGLLCCLLTQSDRFPLQLPSHASLTR